MSISLSKIAKNIHRKTKENILLLIDVDFRYSTDVTERQTDEHIIQFLELIVSKISKIYIPKETEFNIYVLEKQSPNLLDDVTKDGIHLMIDIEMDFTAKTLLPISSLTKFTMYGTN